MTQPNPTSTSNGRTTPPPPDADERLAWLALTQVPGLGSRKLGLLLSRFGSAGSARGADTSTLSAINGLTDEMARAIQSDRIVAAAERIAKVALELGQVILVPTDEAYPGVLRTIPDPPAVLFAHGNLDLLTPPAVAIVGSRRHSAYGADVARNLGKLAAEAGIVVVSGMAKGLDAEAHLGALDGRGGTIGVLGTGADCDYPTSNQSLFKELRAKGLLLTEHPPGGRPHPGSFPRRNRIISGLSKVLVVVEAAEGSGTLITVTCALEQGREVLAVPGPITSFTSRGTNRLIRDGATPLLQPEDLLPYFGKAAPRQLKSSPPPPVPCTLSADEATVLDALSFDLRHVDDIAERVGLPIGRLLAVLLGLELGGLAEQATGSMYRRRG